MKKKIRLQLFFSMFVGYVFFYFTRKSLVFIGPAMIEEMKISIIDFGFINTIFYLTYAISKFISGIITDKSNPKYIMAFGLMFTGFLNICITFFSYNVKFILFFWTLNAFFQGWGWPAITKSLSYLYKKNERGLWWSIYSLSHNFAGAIAPIIIGFITISYNWKVSMFFIGFLAIIISFVLFIFMYNIPKIYNKKNSIKKNFFTIFFYSNIWLFSFLYLFLYLVKTIINDWTILFLINQKKYDLISAGFSIFCFEVSGILGMILSGLISDKFFYGNRIIYIFFSSFVLFILSIIFWLIPLGYQLADYLIISLFGFFIFGLQMLIGLISSEFVEKNLACTANGFVGTWGYFGAAMTGYPFGIVVNLSWNVYFFIILLSTSLLLVITLFLIIKFVYEKK